MSLLFRLGYDVDAYWVSPEGITEHVAHFHASGVDWLHELPHDETARGWRIRARDLVPLLLDGPPKWNPMRSPYGVIGGPVDIELAERIPEDDWLAITTVDTS